MFYTLGTAAKATGYTKPTIREAISEGRLSATKNEKGWYQIDPAELQRVYGKEMLETEAKRKAPSETLHPITPESDTALQAVIDANKQAVEQLEARIREKDELVTDLKTRLHKTENLLEDKRSEAEKAKSKLVDIELLPSPVIKRRRLTLKERLFGGEIAEVEESA